MIGTTHTSNPDQFNSEATFNRQITIHHPYMISNLLNNANFQNIPMSHNSYPIVSSTTMGTLFYHEEGNNITSAFPHTNNHQAINLSSHTENSTKKCSRYRKYGNVAVGNISFKRSFSLKEKFDIIRYNKYTKGLVTKRHIADIYRVTPSYVYKTLKDESKIVEKITKGIFYPNSKYSNEQKYRMIQDYERGTISKPNIARKYHVNYSTLVNIINQKQRVINDYDIQLWAIQTIEEDKKSM